MGNYNALINKSYSFKREVQGPSSIDYRSTPPQWVLDKIAEEKISAGFVLKKSNLCNTCFQYRSSNGSCGCE